MDATPQAPPATPAVEVQRLKFSGVLDQCDEGTFVTLTDEQRSQFKQNHIKATGARPPPGREPPDEQLAALKAKMDRGHAPYADFAVFLPHGKRAQRHHRFHAQIFVEGRLTTLRLGGPEDYEQRKACWALFRAAIICLDAMSLATLDAYERGIASLVRLFPSHWPIIYCADETMRMEQWIQAYHRFKDEGTLPNDRPWDFVVRYTTYGGEDIVQTFVHWWNDT